MSTDTKICLDSLQEVTPDVKVPLEVDVYLPRDEHGSRYIRRKRWRTFTEVFRDMHKALNLSVCESCGHEKQYHRDDYKNRCSRCQSEMYALIDEYDSGYDDKHTEIGTEEEHIQEIVCYCHVGGNEGYYAECGVLLRVDYGATSRYVRLYWLKSFRSMVHVHDIVRRMMLATGVWPCWGNES